ncbi:hypothetical protein Pcinc_023962 [Petrolisthes cinctipes]|uniref:DDE-1 domain-containing protein n=1 Tax=Petrolisthes cinctipes TaxID=88211 RepID=A0AAE1FBZ6_PETCI|nr:hypothetical protein Pcinc_023962 [Petrolisthes cinctipes]
MSAKPPKKKAKGPQQRGKTRPSPPAYTQEDILKAIEDLENEINALDALQDPAWNFNIDESGFCLSPTHGKVVVPKGEKHVFEETSIYHMQNLTVLGCMCSDGSLPSPIIIYPRKRMSANIVEKFPVGYEFTVGKSEKGYITYETLFEYLCNSFHDWLNAHNVKRPVIVWTDWHETRNNYFLAKTLNELNIILYGLPPNTTHFLQPLDVSVFGSLKKEWTKAVKLWEQHHHDEVLTQINFAEVLLPVYYSHVTPDKIKAGFDKCVLLPFNPERPDYSKLQAAAAQKEHYSTIFEGVDQSGFKEIGTQICMALISRGTQTNVASLVTTTTERKEHYNFTRSMCDLVIEYKAYAPLKETYKGAPFIYPTMPEFVNNYSPELGVAPLLRPEYSPELGVPPRPHPELGDPGPSCNCPEPSDMDDDDTSSKYLPTVVPLFLMKANNFCIQVVKQVDEEGLTVSFLKEKHKDFFVTPDKEELSYPVKREEVVVLEPPVSVCENRTYGFKYHKNMKLAVQAYFAN